MAEKISNGGFSAGLNGWYNYGAYNFVASIGMAAAQSDESIGLCQHKLRQYFSVTGTALTATVHAHIAWECYHKAAPGSNGSARFFLNLRKPNGEVVQIATYYIEATSSDEIGSMDLANYDNIVDHIDQVGTYYLELVSIVASARWIPIDEPVYIHSYGWFDSISLLMTERFSKIVNEAIGGGELPTLQASGAASEAAQLTETISHHGGYQPGVDPKQEVMKHERAGLYETLQPSFVTQERAEGAGLAETLTRTYGYRQRDLPGMPNIVGLHEYLRARWTKGNMTLARTITPVDNIWEKIVPVDETNWQSLTDETPGVVGGGGA